MAFSFLGPKCASSLKGALVALALMAVPAHASLTFTLAFNGVGVTNIPNPFSDSMSISAANDFTHFTTAMALNTNYNIVDPVLNFNAVAPDKNSTKSLNITQTLGINLGAGETLSNTTPQNLAFVFQDAENGNGTPHVLSVTTLPSATFNFTDGTRLVITATSVPAISLLSGGGTASSDNNAMDFNIAYLSGAPEPSSVGLAALGILGMAAALRRRSQAK